MSGLFFHAFVDLSDGSGNILGILMDQFGSLSYILCGYFQFSGGIAYLIYQLLGIRDHIGRRSCQILELIMSLGRYRHGQIALCNITELSGDSFHVILNTGSNKDTHDHNDHTCQEHQSNGHITDLHSLAGHHTHRHQCTGGKAHFRTAAIDKEVFFSTELHFRSAGIRYCLLHYPIIKFLIDEYFLILSQSTLFTVFQLLHYQFSSTRSDKSDDTVITDIDLLQKVRNSQRLHVNNNAGIVRLAHHLERQYVVLLRLFYLFIQHRMAVDPLWDASSAFAGSYRLLIFIQESIHTGRKLGRQKSHTFLGNNVHMTDERIRRLHR